MVNLIELHNKLVEFFWQNNLYIFHLKLTYVTLNSYASDIVPNKGIAFMELLFFH